MAKTAETLEKIDVLELLKNNPQWGPPFEGDIDCQAFYELMQNYRWKAMSNHSRGRTESQADVCQAYELVMDFVREWANYQKQ